VRILFWQNIPSPHQSAVIRSLADRNGIEVFWVVESDIDAHRKKMGWSMPELGQVKLVVTPSADTVYDLINRSPKDSVHIFSPNRSLHIVSRAFALALKTDALVGLMSETADLRGVKGITRLVLGRLKSNRYKRRVNFVLAIGSNGVRWYRMCGFHESKFFPYGYFVETSQRFEFEPRTLSDGIENQVKLFFVGRLEKGKGLDILLKALQNLKNLDWHLLIIGDGSQRKPLESLCTAFGLNERVRFLGPLPNSETIQTLADGDLMILPSRWKDGWGAVVNEALMQGVPVFCSDKCGAADLLRDPIRGDVFISGSVDDLQRKLASRIAMGKLSPQTRMTIKEWSRAIEGKVVASYLLDILAYLKTGGIRPIAPWLS
jgi:glycosyltransferase involved in cell wall biosynthesis